ncbi:MAG: hypothetical protein M3Y81_16310 [Chloroflexota bacterium]|nr:hypothetical protein [Chloroflexota bacterium]
MRRNPRSVFLLTLSLLLVGCASSPFLPASGSTGSSTASLTAFSQPGVNYEMTFWSPDGRWVVAAATDVPGEIDLFSSNGQVVSTWKNECDLYASGEGFSWLLDGRWSCPYGNEPPLLEIRTLSQKGHMGTQTLIPLPTNPGTIVETSLWNPRHFWLATIAESQPGLDNQILYLSDLSGRRLAPPLDVNGSDLAWSPDGTTLAVVQRTGDVLLLDVHEQANGLLALQKQRTLSAGTANDEPVAWSPSGRWLICRHGTYEQEDYLFLLATDGSGKQVKLTSSLTDGQLLLPSWSPDGTRVLVTIVGSGQLFSIDMATFLKAHKLAP